MPTHRVTTDIATVDRGLLKMGTPIDYDGEPDWHYEPLDEDALAHWKAHVAWPASSTELQRKWTDFKKTPEERDADVDRSFKAMGLHSRTLGTGAHPQSNWGR